MNQMIMAVTAESESINAACALVEEVAEVGGVTRVEFRVRGASWAWPDAMPGEADLADEEVKLQFASTKARDEAGKADLTVEDLGTPSSKNGYTLKDVRRALKG